MSYDLEVVTHARPTDGAVARLAAGFGDLEVDGPVTCEPEDLDEELAAAVIAPRWLLELHLPFGLARTRLAAVLKAARAVATEFQGAVFDPQEGAVVFPKRQARRFKPPSGEERIREVDLRWYFARSSADEIGRICLDTIRRHLPEAVPVRFGAFEPLQHRLERDGDGAFLTAARKAVVAAYDRVFWTATPPCFNGSLGGLSRGHHGQASVGVSIDLDARALETDTRWLDAATSLFEAVARRGAFYAVAYVQRGVILNRGRTYSDEKTEKSPVIPIDWIGLPPDPAWLTWFGPPYAELVRGSLDGAAEERGDGLLLRLGRAPQDADALRGLYPSLPAELVCPRVTKTHGPMSWEELDPAAVVPALDR